jgi:hypothetical protein
MSTDHAQQIREQIREQFKWRRVQAPQRWSPTEVGQEVVGYYGGQTVKTGAYGQYQVVLIHIPMGQSLMLSGTKLIQLVDASLIPPGHPIRVIWKGLTDLRNGHTMKDFEVLVAEGEAIPFDSLPVSEEPDPRSNLSLVENSPETEVPAPPAKLFVSASQNRGLKRLWANLRRYHRACQFDYLAEDFIAADGLVVVEDGCIIPNPEIYGERRNQPIPVTPVFLERLAEDAEE